MMMVWSFPGQLLGKNWLKRYIWERERERLKLIFIKGALNIMLNKMISSMAYMVYILVTNIEKLILKKKCILHYHDYNLAGPWGIWNALVTFFWKWILCTCSSKISTILKLKIPFRDADEFHSKENKKKMSEGIPLTDQVHV